MEKVIVIVFVALCVAGFSLGMNFVEQQKVITELNMYLTPQNAHVFGKSEQTKQRVAQMAEAVVGPDKNVEVFMYTIQTVIPLADVRKPGNLPKLRGIKVNGDYVEISVLVARVWWTQKLFWYKPQDTYVTRVVIVPADSLGYGYPSAPSDFDLVQHPEKLIDSLR